MELAEDTNTQYGIEPEFVVPKTYDIELYGYTSKMLRFGFLDTSPFVRKVETYLELIGTDYRKMEGNVAKAPRKVLPYMNYRGLCVVESSDIINYLRKNVKDLNKGIVFNRYQKTLMHMITTTLENSFFYCTLHQDYFHDEQWKQTKKREAKGKGFAFTAVVPRFKRSTVKALLEGQGYGKWPDNQVIDRGLLDLQCVESSLEMHGESPYFMGERASIIDAIIFSFLIPYFKMNPEHKRSRLYRSITAENFPKLFALCDHMYNRLIKEKLRIEGDEKQGTELMENRVVEIPNEKPYDKKVETFVIEEKKETITSKKETNY